MKIFWKKPWTLIAWIIRSERFEAVDDPASISLSRFGPKGFWGWLFASEAELFEEEPVMEPGWSQFGKGGFWKWLLAPERFVEEPEITVHSPRFGRQTFLRWLFLPEGKSGLKDDDKEDSPNHSRYFKEH
jgi:hypothetical protein